MGFPLQFPVLVQWEHWEWREKEARTVSRLVKGELLSSCKGNGSSKLVGLRSPREARPGAMESLR